MRLRSPYKISFLNYGREEGRNFRVFVNLQSKSIKIPVKEIIFGKVAGLQPACLLKNEFLRRHFPRVLN